MNHCWSSSRGDHIPFSRILAREKSGGVTRALRLAEVMPQRISNTGRDQKMPVVSLFEEPFHWTSNNGMCISTWRVPFSMECPQRIRWLTSCTCG